MAPTFRLPYPALLALAILQAAAVEAAAQALPGTKLFARQNSGCISGCGSPGDCNCAADETCALVPQTCLACAYIKCNPSSKGSSSSGGKASSSTIGAIAGGTIGGLAVLGVILFFLWRRWARKRRAESMEFTEKENDFGTARSARASTHTVASIASTVRTRASNIIQIAYIPGVTNRSQPGTPHLVPPVPPLPIMDQSSPVGSQFPRTPNGDIKFAADDILRQSTYTNRSSVATTIYGGGAVVAQPTIMRAGKAAMVQVKGGSAGTSSANSPLEEEVPPVPALFASKVSAIKGKAKLEGGVPASPAFSIGSTFFNRMNSTKSSEADSGVAQPRSRTLTENHRTSTIPSDSEDETEADLGPGHRAKKMQSQCSSCITDMDTGSPFSDSNSISIDEMPLPPNTGLPPSGTTRRASVTTAEKRKSRQPSPFDDPIEETPKQ